MTQFSKGVSEMSRVRIGFAGVGFMGQAAHLRNYVRNEDCEVVALAEPRTDLARKVAAAYGIQRVYRSHLELAEDPDVDAVVASQPFLMNGFIATPILRAGKHCFIEKPMAGSYAEAAEMVDAAEGSGAKLMVGFMKRYDSGVNRAKSVLDDAYASGNLGALGLVNAYCFGGDWLRGVRPPITTVEPVPTSEGWAARQPDWMTIAQKDTFNTYMNIFSHNLNLVRYLYPGKLEVRAALLREGMLNQSTLFESDGVLINLYGVSVRSQRWEERTEFYFDNGWARVLTPSPMEEQASARVEAYDGNAQQATSQEGEPYWAFRAQADHFIACVKGDTEPRSSGQDSLEDIRLMEDVFRKAEWV
jgi:predicted dehydrogenase